MGAHRHQSEGKQWDEIFKLQPIAWTKAVQAKKGIYIALEGETKGEEPYADPLLRQP